MAVLQRLIIIAILILNFSFWSDPAYASVPLNDEFKVNSVCEAFHSIRQKTNPGDITVSPGETYIVTAKNKENETHYLLNIEDANPKLRWVDVNCGELLGISSVTPSPLENAENVLAISWQPAFCETHQKKDECKSQTSERFDASNFTLHGLWPKPVYCQVSNDIKQLDRDGEWSELPPISLSDPLFKELQKKMPGVASNLHLHEWYKHGTCYSDTPEEYYQESLALLDQVNDSDIQKLFFSNVGKVLESDLIREKFSSSFSNNAGKKVNVSCKRDRIPTKRRMIVELKLNLKGDIESDTSISDLFVEGETVGSGCPSGEIDLAGLDELQ